MHIIKPLILLIALYFFAVDAYSTVYTVTSNADAGSGTLREALMLAAANGTTDKDFIYFNLPDQTESGRTITLLSELPPLTSNLSIDAATQPGLFFGVSTARVQLFTAFASETEYRGLILLNLNDVEIYGLYIKNLLKDNGNYFYQQGMCIKDCKNVQIGAVGKGNVICGFMNDLTLNLHEVGGQIHHYSENITLKANFIAIEADGTTLSTSPLRTTFWYVYGQVNIGGSAGEGNLFAKGLEIAQANSYNYTNPGSEISTLPAIINIKNNKFGVDYTGTRGLAGSRGLYLSSHNPGGKNTIAIEDNLISSEQYGIFIGNSGRRVSILRNYIGVDKTRTKKLPIGGTGMFLYGGDDIHIGDNDPSNANHVAYCKPVNIWPYTTAAVNKNSFFCTVDAYPMILDSYGTRPFPIVSIKSISVSSVIGTATPNSSIELFYSDNCQTCSPETYFASAIADATGNWQYNGPINGTIIASATYNNATSEFTRTRIDASQVQIVNTCSASGSIKGAMPVSASSIKWLDENGNIVGSNPDLLNMPPGTYKLQVANGDCMAEANYHIWRSLVLNASNVKTADPSCGNSNGYVRGILVTNNTATQSIYSWKDAAGIQIAQTADLNNMKAGSYTLTVKTADNLCSETYGPVILRSVSAPVIDESSIAITPSSCGNTGSITGMIVTGPVTLSYRWKNNQGGQVAITKDLFNQPPGTYILEVSDPLGCTGVSRGIVIPDINGININDSALKISASSCSLSNGSVTGISITGATNYMWLNESGQTVGTTLDLNNVQPGKYRLRISNRFCTKETRLFTVTALPQKVFSVAISSTSQASCGLANGSIAVVASGDQPKTYKWIDTFGNVISISTTLTNAPAGIYKLYLTDDNGCENFYQEYIIEDTPPLLVDKTAVVKKSDQCNLQEAAISGLKVSGGKLPYSYQWMDAEGKVIGSTLDIQNILSGTYQLQITDATSCNTLNLPFSIQNIESVLPTPIVPSSQLCAAGKVNLQVSNPLPGKYILYDEERSKILAESSSGLFETNVLKSCDYYVSYRLGGCESSLTKVHITVGITAENIPNKISPNGDGINDQWLIEGLQYYPNADVKIYSRSGSVVYQSKGYLRPFDGTQNGSQLPVGPYYYVIDFGTACNKLSGNLNLLR